MRDQVIDPGINSKGIEIVNLTKNGQLARRENLAIDFSLNNNNKSDHWIKTRIDDIWEEACSVNRRLYNRSKFRLAGCFNSDTEFIVFKIGLTSYKDLIATNCHPFGKHLVEYAKNRFSDPKSYLADVLGVGSLLLTTDRKFVFIKRALWTGEDAGKLDRPGGHPEPDNVSPSVVTWSEEECAKPENRKRIRDEIFDSVLHEIRDEINIPLETLTDPALLGVVRSIERLGRPSAEFLVRCSLSSEEIQQLYNQNSQPEADESQGILFIDEESVRFKNIPSDMGSNLTDAAWGAIELYNQLSNSYQL